MLSDSKLEKLERSKAYSIVDFLLNWIFEGIGGLLLLAYSMHWWGLYNEGRGFVFDWRLGFWKKVLLLGIVLILTKTVKDELLAWMGIAPPDEKWVDEAILRKPKQEASILPSMDLIRITQNRGERIRERGIRVDQLLAENEAFFRRRRCAERNEGRKK